MRSQSATSEKPGQRRPRRRALSGLDAVATILVELAEKLDSEKLSALAPTVPLPWAQRLGYLLERIGEASKTGLLKEYVRKHAREAAALQPSAPAGNHPRDRDWKLVVNADIEAETMRPAVE